MKMSVGKSSNGGATIRCAALHKEGAPSNGADQSGRSPAGSFITLMCFQAVDNGTTASDQGVPISAPPSHFSREAREV